MCGKSHSCAYRMPGHVASVGSSVRRRGSLEHTSHIVRLLRHITDNTIVAEEPGAAVQIYQLAIKVLFPREKDAFLG